MTQTTPPDQQSIARFLDQYEQQNRHQAEMLTSVNSMCSATKEAIEQMRTVHEETAQWVRDIRQAAHRAEDAGQGLGEAYGQMIMAFHQAGPGASADSFMRVLADQVGMPAERYQQVENALASNRPSAGGVIIPPTFIAEIVPFFRVTPTLFRLGVRMITIGAGDTYVPRLVSGTAATWHLENEEIGLSEEPKWGALAMRPHKLGVRIRMSTSFAKSGNAAQTVAMDAVQAQAQEWSRVLWHGSGAKQPLGIFSAQLKAQLPQFTESIDVKERSFWSRMKRTFRKANKGQIIEGPVWCYNEDVTCRLEEAENGFGVQKYPSLEQGRHMGYPVQEDFQLVTTSAAPDTTQVALVVPNEIFFGQHRMNELAWSSHSRFSYDQLEMLVITEGDIGPRQLKAICVSESGIVEDVA